MKDIVFRKADINDIEKLVNMRIEYLKEDLGEIAVANSKQLITSLYEFFKKHLDLDIDAFVAEYVGEIISTSYTAYYYRIPHPNFPTGYAAVPINGYTKPEYRKHGLAGTLLKISAEYAKNKGVEFLNMEVTGKGLSVCKKMGFEEMNYTPVQMILK